MDFWERAEQHLEDSAGFNRPPKSVKIRLNADDMSTIEVSGTWMEEKTDDVLSGDEPREHPVTRSTTLNEGSFYKEARDRLETALSRVDVGGGEVSDITLFGPTSRVPFVSADESIRLLITTESELEETSQLHDVRESIAGLMGDIDSDVTTDDVVMVEAFFSDFQQNDVCSVDATVLTETPSNYHPDVESPQDVADAIADDADEREKILNASVFGEQYLGREHDDSLDPSLAETLEELMDETVHDTVTVNGDFAIEGESIRTRFVPFPDDGYDIMSPSTYRDEEPAVETVVTGFWLHVGL